MNSPRAELLRLRAALPDAELAELAPLVGMGRQPGDEASSAAPAAEPAGLAPVEADDLPAPPLGWADRLWRAVQQVRRRIVDWASRVMGLRSAPPRSEEARGWPVVADETLFWRVVSVQHFDSGGALQVPSPSRPQAAAPGPDRSHFGGALLASPAPTPAARWAELRGPLWAALSQRVDAPRIDVDRAVAAAARRRIELPRARAPRWPERLVVLVDRIEALEPIFTDQDLVVDQLRAEAQRGSVEVVCVTGAGEPSPAEGWLRGAAVLLLTAGIIGVRGDDWRAAWVGAAVAAGLPCCVLTATPGSALPAGCVELPWGRSAQVAPVAHEERRAGAERLLTLAAPLGLVQLGLLRELRGLLPPDDGPLWLELAAWSAVGVRRLPGIGLVFEAELQQRLTARLSALPAELQQAALELSLRWRNGLPEELRHAEVLRWVGAPAVRDQLIGSREVAAALAWLPKLLELALEGEPGRAAVACAFIDRWLDATAPGLLEAGPEGALISELGEVAAARKRGRQEPEVEREWRLGQRGGELELTAVDPGVDPTPGPEDASFIATLRLRGRLRLRAADGPWRTVAVEPGALLRLPAVGQVQIAAASQILTLAPLTRADDGGWAAMGRDEFGLWADADLKGVVQRFRWIPPGRFRMGSADDEKDAFSTERPQHEVDLVEGYWLGDTPVTQALWRALTGESPSNVKDWPEAPRRPVENVSWDDAQAALRELNGAQRAGLVYRLPSEAEWERAVLAGSARAVPLGLRGQGRSGLVRAMLSDVLAVLDNPGPLTHPVAETESNVWGLYDMTGNVREWCQDVGYSSESSTAARNTAAAGEADAPSHSIRGSNWPDTAKLGVVVGRAEEPTLRSAGVGLRLSRGPAHQFQSNPPGRLR